MTARTSRILSIALWLSWAILWAIHPNLESDLIDLADTESYGSFQSHVGYRWMFVALVKALLALGLTLHESAVVINALLLAYLFYLLDVFLRMERSELRLESIVLVSLASPLLVLQKNLLSSDLVSGLLFFHAFLRIERTRRSEAPLSWRDAWVPGLLLVIAQNVKSTALISSALYAALLLVFGSNRDRRIVGSTTLWAALFFTIDLAGAAAIFRDPLHRFRMEIGKPMGGNAPNEIEGARASVPVPLALFHVFGHLKTIGRYGLPGLVALLSLYRWRKIPAARLYAAALIVFAILGTRGMFALERYWLAYLPFMLGLFALTWRSFGSAARVASLALGIAIALTNYFLRYYPTLYQALGDRAH